MEDLLECFKIGTKILIGPRIARSLGCLHCLDASTIFSLEYIGRGYYIFRDNKRNDPWMIECKYPEDIKRIYTEVRIIN